MPAGALSGRRAIVTGAGSGIGEACALSLTEGGAAVAVLDVRRDAADEAAAKCAAGGGHAIAIQCDVGDEGSVTAAVASAAQELGGIDTVVAAAGIARPSRTHELPLTEWETVIRVNLTGVFLTLKHTLEPLVAAGGGSIVTIGSVASLVAAGSSSSYDAAFLCSTGASFMTGAAIPVDGGYTAI